MTYQEFIAVVEFRGPSPQTHDFYKAQFNTNKSDQEFAEYFSSHITDLPSYPFAKRFGEFYFCVPVDKTVPDNFADNLEKATDKPLD